jgi:glycine/D-amino acid oxidase-like deaminating enzyme
VTIYTKQMPPDTTSNVAGGYWNPVTLFERGKQGKEFSANYARAAQFSHRYFQQLTHSVYAVRWLPVYSLSNPHPAPAVTASPAMADPFPEIQQLFPAGRNLEAAESPFSVARTRVRFSMLIEPPVYLNALLRDYQLAGGRVQIRDFQNVSEVLSLAEPAVVNCTGLGAKALFADSELTPVKGQLAFLLPQPEINYCTVGPEDLYMFPRQDGILLGGTHEEGVWGTDVDAAQVERIVAGNGALFSAMR